MVERQQRQQTVLHRPDGTLAREKARRATSLGSKKPWLKGGASERIRDSKVVNALIGKKEDPVPVDVRKANADVLASVYRTNFHNRDVTQGNETARFKLWHRKPKEVRANIDRVYPKFEEWWEGFATRMMKLYPPEQYPYGPGEKSPIYFKWQMARSFYEHGKVQVAKIQEAFMDPDFFNTTMMLIEHEATLKMHALGVRKEFDRIFKSRNVLRTDTVGASTPDLGKLLVAGLEIDAALAVALGTIALTAATAGTALPPALVSMMAGYLGAAAIGMTGTALVEQIAVGGLKTLFDGLRANGQIRVFTDTCQTSLRQIQANAPIADYMRDVYHIDPRQIKINNQGAVEFVKGTDSASWVAVRHDLEADIRLREHFLVDMVGVDMKRAHALTEQFLTQGYPRQRGGRRPSWLGGSRRLSRKAGSGVDSMIVNQTGSAYEHEVLTEFALLREKGASNLHIDTPTPLEQANAARLQILYIEAGKRVLARRAEPMFRQTLAEISASRAQTDGIDAKQKTIDQKVEEWGRGTKGADGKVTKEGSRRQEAKKEAEKVKQQAEQLIDGVEAKDGNPAREGLIARKEALRGTDDKGLFKRQENVQLTFKDAVSELRNAGFRTQADVLDGTPTVASILGAIGAIETERKTVETTIAEYTYPNGALYAKAKRDYEMTIARINIVPTPDRYKKNPSLIGEDKEKALQLLKTSQDAIQEEYNKRSERIQKLTDLISSLQTKIKQLETAQTELSSTRAELVAIRRTPDAMRKAYTDVTTTSPPNPPVIKDDLQKYGQTGNDMLTLINKWKAPRTTALSLAQVSYDEQEIVILAVAEARAAEVYHQNTGKDEYLNPPTGVHADMLTVLTAEQLVVLPPARIREILDSQTTLTVYGRSPVDTPEAKLAAIVAAQTHETQCYMAREKGLQETINTQRIVVTGLEKAVQNADKESDRKLNQIHLVKKYLEDRAHVYGEVEHIRSFASLNRYLVGYSVGNPANQMREEDKRQYSRAEMRLPNLPKGFVDFLRDIFKYHEMGRGADAVAIDGVNSDILFDTLLDVLGGPSAQEIVARAIVRAVEPSGQGAQGFREFMLPPLPAAPMINPENLSFTQVMSILAYRANPQYARPPEAVWVPAPQPITHHEMMNIVGNIMNIAVAKVEGHEI